MARRKMKVCTISGRKFTADTKNFYVNTNTTDGYTKFHISQLETDFPSVKKSGFYPQI